MKYSELSNFEINVEIAKRLRISTGRASTCGGVYCSPGGDSGQVMDWCNNWRDAGQLMEENGISIQFCKFKQNWTSRNADGVGGVNSKNPKRAIAECFLMMKDAENER